LRSKSLKHSLQLIMQL